LDEAALPPHSAVRLCLTDSFLIFEDGEAQPRRESEIGIGRKDKAFPHCAAA